MKRSVLFLLIIGLAALALSGCGKVVGLVFEPDLTVEGAYTEEWDGAVTGVRAEFENDGVWLSDVEWSIYISEDQIFNEYDDVWVFSDEFDIGFKGWEDETAQVFYFDPGAISDMPDGEYFLIVVVDSNDDIDESDEDNNWRLAQGPMFVIAGGTGGGDGFTPDDWDEMGNDWYPGPTFDMGMWHYANLHDGDDVDWYTVNVDMSNELHIYTRRVSEETRVDLFIEVYSQYNTTDWITRVGPAIDHNVYLPPMAAAETYYIRIFSETGEIGEYEFMGEQMYMPF